jgi:predicted  nucleic acid-binding Zn-ribbon protein
MYWYTQRDNQDKLLQNMQTKLDRCRPAYPETSNKADVLKLQIDQTSKEKSKCCDRLMGADTKLLGHLGHFIDHQGDKLQSTYPRGVPSEELEARLGALRKSLHEQLYTRLKNDFTKSCDSIQIQFQNETSQLKASLQKEREKTSQLEKKLDHLQKDFGNLHKNQLSLTDDILRNSSARLALDIKVAGIGQKMTQLSRKVEDAIKDMATTEAVSIALEEFDDDLSAPAFGESAIPEQLGHGSLARTKTRRHLQLLGEEINGLKLSLQADSDREAPPCIRSLRMQIDTCTHTINTHSNQHKLMSEAVTSVEDSLKQISLTREMEAKAQPRSQPSTTKFSSQSEVDIGEIVDAKVQPSFASLTKNLNYAMQEKLNKVAQDLGAFIDKERIARGLAATKADEACAAVSNLHQEFIERNKAIRASICKLNEEVGHQGTQISLCNDMSASLDSQLQEMAKGAEENAEKFALQMQVVNAWQSNFTTKSLYQDISDHMTGTLSSSVMRKLASLTSRMEAIEGSMVLSGDGSPRKRKTPHK